MVRLGVLEIGSHTVHPLLIDVHLGASVMLFSFHKVLLQLLKVADETGAISETAPRVLIDFVTEVDLSAAEHRAQDLLAFATSAIRESSNGSAITERVCVETVSSFAELSGPEEAATTFVAVRRWYGWGGDNILNLDIGGDCFELGIGAGKCPISPFPCPSGPVDSPGTGCRMTHLGT